MHDLSLPELKLGINEFLAGRGKSAFDSTHAALIFRPRFAKIYARLEALPPTATELPQVDNLQGADGRRDGFARALLLLAEAVAALPGASADLVATVGIIKQAFVPSRDITRQPYAEAAASTEQDAKELEAHRAALATVPTPDGRTLAAWVADFIAAGNEIGRLLVDRGQTLGTQVSREGAGGVRNEAVAALNELRRTLDTERAHRTDLAPTVDGEIFGALDELQRLAAARNAAARLHAAAKPAPASGPGPAGTPPTSP